MSAPIAKIEAWRELARIPNGPDVYIIGLAKIRGLWRFDIRLWKQHVCDPAGKLTATVRGVACRPDWISHLRKGLDEYEATLAEEQRDRDARQQSRNPAHVAAASCGD